MATKITPATLTVKVTESVSLNGVSYGGTNTFVKTSCGQVNQRIINVAAGSNTEIASFGSADAKGEVIAANLKYFRVTNLDDTNFIGVVIYDATAGNEAAIKVDPLSSFFFTTDDFYANDDSSVDFAGSYATAESIYLHANTAACDVEFMIVTT